jgi:phage tail protein X
MSWCHSADYPALVDAVMTATGGKDKTAVINDLLKAKLGLAAAGPARCPLAG